MIAPRKVIVVAAAFTAFAAGLSWHGGSITTSGVFPEAQARVGRPLTPMSYAGVARRTTRRAVDVVSLIFIKEATSFPTEACCGEAQRRV